MERERISKTAKIAEAHEGPIQSSLSEDVMNDITKLWNRVANKSMGIAPRKKLASILKDLDQEVDNDQEL